MKTDRTPWEGQVGWIIQHSLAFELSYNTFFKTLNISLIITFAWRNFLATETKKIVSSKVSIPISFPADGIRESDLHDNCNPTSIVLDDPSCEAQPPDWNFLTAKNTSLNPNETYSTELWHSGTSSCKMQNVQNITTETMYQILSLPSGYVELIQIILATNTPGCFKMNYSKTCNGRHYTFYGIISGATNENNLSYVYFGHYPIFWEVFQRFSGTTQNRCYRIDFTKYFTMILQHTRAGIDSLHENGKCCQHYGWRIRNIHSGFLFYFQQSFKKLN